MRSGVLKFAIVLSTSIVLATSAYAAEDACPGQKPVYTSRGLFAGCAPDSQPNAVRVYLHVDPGTESLSSGLAIALPQWWSHATRGLGRLEIVTDGKIDVVLFITNVSQVGGFYSAAGWSRAYVFVPQCAWGQGCWMPSADDFRLLVLHELAHHWCCYGPGSGTAVNDAWVGDHWMTCSWATDLMCSGGAGRRSAPYRHTFSDRELRAMGLLR